MQLDNKQIQLGWISGMPRSGTTWLSQILASCADVRLKFCPLFSYEFKNLLDETSDAQQWSQLFTDVYQTNSDFLDQQHLRKKQLIPTFENKNLNPGHLLIKSNRFHNLTSNILKLNSQIRFLHVVRHPCASIYSWVNNPLEFPRDADLYKEWRSGGCRKGDVGEFWGFDDWLKVTRNALKLSELYPDRFRIIRYEKVVEDPKAATESLFKYFDLPYEKQTDDFLIQSQGRHDEHLRSVFKRPVNRNRWLGKLDETIVSTIMSEVNGTDLEQFAKN